MIEKYAYPTEAVTLDIGDGRERELRYTLATLRRLRKTFGVPVLTGELFRSIDEDRLPELIFEGLADKSGIADAEALADMIHPAASPYLIQQFLAAFTGAFPTPDPNDGSQPTIPTTT
jgi:hypothetical protein